MDRTQPAASPQPTPPPPPTPPAPSLIKIGGRPASDPAVIKALAAEMAALASTETPLQSADPSVGTGPSAAGGRAVFLLVHGGGTAVSAMQERYGLQPQFRDGIRQTSPAEMDLVDAALAGRMNKALVRQFIAQGLPAAGLSCCDGPLTRAESISPEGTPPEKQSRTGRICEVHPGLLRHILQAGYLPVVSPVSVDSQGRGLNINADEAALALARALPARTLLFLSDIPGILKEDQVIRSLTPLGIEEEIEAGTIAGGMIPKVRSSAQALADGVETVIIGGYRRQGDLEELLEGRAGSRIIRG